MIFNRKDKDDPSLKKRLNSAVNTTGPGPEREDTDKTTLPITYPDQRYRKSKAAMPSTENVEAAKDWVDHGSLL